MYACYSYEPYELYHHGIKGMKWGVRRFQNKDGTLTNAGKKRYSDATDGNASNSKTKFKVTHRDVLEKKYRDLGMSADEAKAAAEKRIKVEKVIAATAGLTVAACTAYYLKNKYTQTYCDQILKAGTTFHNLDATANPRPGEHLYVNYRQNDVNYFRGHFALGKIRKSGHVFNHELTATSDVKIPSINTRKNTFNELFQKDQEFRNTMYKHITGKELPEVLKNSDQAPKILSRLSYNNMWPKFGDKDDPEFNIAKRKYFEALKQKGYDAIVDEWDTNPKVFRSDAPLILLDTSSKSFGKMSIKELTARDILLSQANSKHYTTGRSLLTAVKAPHTNHFTESNRHLSRYNTKSQLNTENINRVISKLSNEEALSYVKKSRGAMIADAGKYMARNEKLTVKEAISKAEFKRNAINTASLAGGYIGANVAIQNLNANTYAKNYIKENPNTKLTYKQIKKMSNYDDKVRQYQEEHPNTELTPTQILKLYYGKKT